jgi:hypothetical protein
MILYYMVYDLLYKVEARYESSGMFHFFLNRSILLR